MNITVTKNPNPGKLPPADQLGFGSVFTDHMFLMDYTDQNGWHNARIVPFGPISMSPAASVLHYGTSARGKTLPDSTAPATVSAFRASTRTTACRRSGSS